MKPLLPLLLIALASCIHGQVKQPADTNQTMNTYDTTNQSPRFEFSRQTAHPTAAALMQEDFFWSPIEETGPFGSDDGSDAAYGFVEWRRFLPSAPPTAYLRDLVARWNYPPFDWRELDTSKISAYISIPAHPTEETRQKLREAMKNSPDTSLGKITDEQLDAVENAASKNMGLYYLLGLDNAIIGTTFAQFVLEGKINSELKSLAITAIHRQLLPMLINRYDNNYRPRRKEQLQRMLGVLMKVEG